MTRLFLGVQALIFLGFGGMALMDPLSLVENFGMIAEGRHAVYELRGIYGGVSLGAGLLAVAGTLQTSLVRPAIYFLMAYTGGYMIARIAGLFMDGMPEPYFWAFIGFEAVTALIAFLLIRKNSAV